MKKMLFVLTLPVLVTFVSEVKAIQKPASETVQEAPTSTAPGRPAIEKMEKFFGMIEKVDHKGKIIVVKGKMTDGKKVLTFVINHKTKITQGKTALIFGDLKKEMWVSIEYIKDMSKMIAMTIEVFAHENVK